MDLKKYKLEDLILSAVRSEMDSMDVYSKIADRVANAFVKDRFIFLAKEEEKHRMYLEALYAKKCPGKKLRVPEKSVVPMPKIRFDDEKGPVSEIIFQAMEAEQSASSFYRGMAKHLDKDREAHATLIYFSDMEMNHFRLLETEMDNMKKFEEFETAWPMMHIGT